MYGAFTPSGSTYIPWIDENNIPHMLHVVDLQLRVGKNKLITYTYQCRGKKIFSEVEKLVAKDKALDSDCVQLDILLDILDSAAEKNDPNPRLTIEQLDFYESQAYNTLYKRILKLAQGNDGSLTLAQKDLVKDMLK